MHDPLTRFARKANQRCLARAPGSSAWPALLYNYKEYIKNKKMLVGY